MRALCFAERQRHQVWEFVWSQYDWWELFCDASMFQKSILDVAVCNVAHPAVWNIAVLPSIARRLDLWRGFQLWHTTDDIANLDWLPCFCHPATRAPLTIPSAVTITGFFHPQDAAQPVKKQAQDGIVYIFGEFIHWYGTHLGRQRWLEAESEDEHRLKEILRRAFPSSIKEE